MKKVIFLILILCIGIFNFNILQVKSESMIETRYFSNNNTINVMQGISAVQTNVFYTEEVFNVSEYAERGMTAIAKNLIEYGIRIFIISDWNLTLGTYETELTSGTPVAIVNRTTQGYGIQNNTYVIDKYNISRKDSLEIRVYTRYRRTTGIYSSWVFFIASTVFENWVTESLGYDKIINASWNVFYYTQWINIGGIDYSRFYYGDSIHNSRIENMQFDNGNRFNIDFPILLHSTNFFIGSFPPFENVTYSLEYQPITDTRLLINVTDKNNPSWDFYVHGYLMNGTETIEYLDLVGEGEYYTVNIFKTVFDNGIMIYPRGLNANITFTISQDLASQTTINSYVSLGILLSIITATITLLIGFVMFKKRQ